MRAIDVAFQDAQDAAALGCETMQDCQRRMRPAGCPTERCPGPIVSSSGEEVLESAIDAIDEQCAEYVASGCGPVVARCPPPRPVACIDGQCTSCDEQACTSDSCLPCTSPTIIWSTTSGLTGADPVVRHELAGCSSYARFRSPSDLADCVREVPCIGSGELALGHVINALGHPAVQAALADHAVFGGLNRGGTYDLMIGVGDGTFAITGTPCGSDPACVEPPRAVLELMNTLLGFADAYACVASGPCALPFDRGTGSDVTTVYAFDSHLGTCVAKSYSGAGGNANRFDTIDQCRAACPTTASASTCEPGRQFVQDACLECGLVGGCGESAPICARTCSDVSDCAGEVTGTCSPEGVCSLTLCL